MGRRSCSRPWLYGVEVGTGILLTRKAAKLRRISGCAAVFFMCDDFKNMAPPVGKV